MFLAKCEYFDTSDECAVFNTNCDLGNVAVYWESMTKRDMREYEKTMRHVGVEANESGVASITDIIDMN